MTDTAIVDLYWKRSESAISETKNKYNNYLTKIAFNILANPEDSEESVNDTYLKAWNSMPEHRPSELSTYLGRITRQVSIDGYRKRNAKKRQASQYAVSLSELEECVPAGSNPVQETESELLHDLINVYLYSVSSNARTVFLCRYYFMDSINDIAKKHDLSVPNVKTILHRTRLGLKEYLESEGFSV
ncbi:MAG: RNA polymerase sigma factor [Oscillospiraceae bacterium]|nr:RNA polymerase sigma factor [Oscillospiraceae bacterium]